MRLSWFEAQGLRLIAQEPRDIPTDEQMDAHWAATTALVELENKGLVEERGNKVYITDRGKLWIERVDKRRSEEK